MNKTFTLILSLVFCSLFANPSLTKAQTNCPSPMSTTVAGITSTSAQFAWVTTTGASYHILEYRPMGTAVWSQATVQQIPFTLSNLICATGYEWRVTAVCTTNPNGGIILSQSTSGPSFNTLLCNTTCLPPAGVTATNVTQTSATLAWSAIGTNNLYNIQYSSAGSPTMTQINNVPSPYMVTNLTCNTIYIFQVQTICPSPTGIPVVSAWSAPFTLITAACQNACPTPTNLASTNISQTGAVLSWNTSSPTSGFNLQYHIAGTTAWTSLNNISSPYQLGGLSCNTTYEWRVQSICVNSPTGVATLSPWSNTHTFTTLACQNNCLAPTGLNASNVTQTGATVSWQNTTANGLYNIQYLAGNSSNWIQVNGVSSPYNLTGLTCNTIYIFQVQAICTSPNGVITLSPWSAPFTFVTPACQNNCPAPTNLTSTNISQTGAVLSWTANTTSPNSYNLRYRNSATAAWVAINNVSTPWQLSGLNCNTTYEWQVQNICLNSSGTATLSPWSASAFFTTMACLNNCPAPTNLTTTNILMNSATLNWSVVPGASAYVVRYRVVGTLAWTFVTTTNNSVTVNALNCAVTYQWRVRAICSPVSNNTANPLSVFATFTTQPCSTNCPAPTSLTVGNVTATSATLAWTSTGAPMYRVRYRIVGSAAWLFQNSVPTTTIIGGLTPLSVYESQVQSICSPNSNSNANPWSSAVIFTTLQGPNNACLAPVNLAATAVNQGTAVLTWNAVAGASAYNVRYKPANSTLPYISVTSTGNVLTISGLNPSTGYEWQVQALCAGVNGVVVSSPWSLTHVFITPMMIVVYPNPVDQQMTVSYDAEESTVIIYELRDIFGKVVYSTQSQAASGNNAINIATGSLHPGWYSLSVIGSGKVTTTRILIQR